MLLEIFLDVFQNLLRVGIRLYRGVDFPDHTLLVNHISVTGSHATFAQGTERFGDFLFRIRKKWDLQLFFFHELLLKIECIGADTENYGIKCGELFSKTAESARFLRSTTRHCLGVEEQNHILLSLEIIEVNLGFFALTCGIQNDLRRWFAFFGLVGCHDKYSHPKRCGQG